MGPITSPTASGTSVGYMKVCGSKRAWHAKPSLQLHMLETGRHGDVGCRVLCATTTDQYRLCLANMLQGWLEGKPGGSPVHCDVRDVATAHISAAERPAASGRYIVSHASTSNPAEVGRWLQVTDRLHRHHGGCYLAAFCALTKGLSAGI